MKRIFVGAGLLALVATTSLAGEGVVALQTADPSCQTQWPLVYHDCNNGTVTDGRA